jgi:mannose/cellobiose epimerase-like protein (N-acyl-D-glucosamine 2-epimerase family)
MRRVTLGAALVLAAATGGCSSGGGATRQTPSYDLAPPLATVPTVLAPETWRAHWVDDLAPYWTTPIALGTPEGNFPTTRGMDGSLQGASTRRPRMLARQVFAYVAGFLLTGDPVLLGHAKRGVDWLITHARDPAGGWYGLLTETGASAGPAPKLAQDAAYCGLGLAAYYFVTRDEVVRDELLGLRDALFDPTRYWDESHQRIRDGLSSDLTQEVDVDNDGGWELVAQLDPINAFLLLTQPVLDDAARRDQLEGDLRRLGTTLTKSFYSAGIFWGVSNKQGVYGGKHVDFGHTLKAFWMLLEIDKRLPDHPFFDIATAGARAALDRAWDPTSGAWAKRPVSPTAVEYGSDWWAYAETDQLAATLSLIDHRYVDHLTSTTQFWLDHYVDRARAVREVVSSVHRDGSGWGWPDNDTSKCNEWKNGYHSSEHALVLWLLGHAFSGEPAKLHFAVPAAMAQTFIATPYFFDGREVAREVLGPIDVAGDTLTAVDVSFADLR